MQILIVEDTEQVSKLLKLKIEKLGHEATIAATGHEALTITKNQMFDLILLDIFLPDTVAYDLIPKLKHEWSGLNIIELNRCAVVAAPTLQPSSTHFTQSKSFFKSRMPS